MNKIAFLSYINRSGSTFLLNKLSNYKNIFVSLEAEILIKLLLNKPNEKFSVGTKNKLKLLFKKDQHFKYWNIHENNISQLSHDLTNFQTFNHLINQYKTNVKPKANYIIFKGNDLFNFYNEIHENDIKDYNIKFLSIIRDPRAIFLSQKNTKFQNKSLNTNPLITSNQWNWFINNINNNKIHLIKYENLINDFKNEFDQILEYLQIKNEKSDELKSLSKIIPNNFKQIHKRIDKNPDTSRINVWQNELNKNIIYIIQKNTKNNLKKMDYEFKEIKHNKSIAFILKSYYMFLIFCRLNKY